MENQEIETNMPPVQQPSKEASKALKYIVIVLVVILWTGLVGFGGYLLGAPGPASDLVEQDQEEVGEGVEGESVDGEVFEANDGYSIPVDDISGTELDLIRLANPSSCFYLRDSEGLGAGYGGIAVEDFGETVRGEIDEYLGQSFSKSIEDDLIGLTLYSVCELSNDYYVLANAGDDFYKTHILGRLNFESPQYSPVIEKAAVVGSGPEPYLFSVGSDIFLHTGYGDAGFINSRYYRLDGAVFEEVQSCSSGWDMDEDGNETTYRGCTKLFTVDEN